MTLHLVRHREPAPATVAPGDDVLHDRDGAWHRGADRLTDEAVLDLVHRAARVVVW